MKEIRQEPWPYLKLNNSCDNVPHYAIYSQLKFCIPDYSARAAGPGFNIFHSTVPVNGAEQIRSPSEEILIS